MSLRILVVDDEPTTTAVLKRVLDSKGYTVREENNASQALSTAKVFQPHVVILDYLMPRLHGGDVAWQLASDPELKNARLVICSGVDPAQFKLRLPPKRIPILEKPIDVEALLELLKSE
jgi:CheY-like chemotaxis protein